MAAGLYCYQFEQQLTHQLVAHTCHIQVHPSTAHSFSAMQEVQPTRCCSSGLYLSAGGDMSLRGGFKYTTRGLMANFLHGAKSHAHPGGHQTLQPRCSSVK